MGEQNRRLVPKFSYFKSLIMLTYKTPYQCDLHPIECPNEYHNEFSEQPHSADRIILNIETPTSTIIKSTKSDCKIESIWALISLLRRNHQEFWPKFLNHLNNNIWYFKNRASIRVLLSILDTIANHRGHQSHIATLATSIIREWQISLSVYMEIESYDSKNIWPTIRTINPVWPDTIKNHYSRVAKSLSSEPIIWLLFFEIYQNIAKTENMPLKSLDRLLKSAAHSSPRKLLKRTTNMLRPTTISPKYRTLYAKLHTKKSNYGSRSVIPYNIRQIFRQWNVQRILDFGCGKGHMQCRELSIIQYDPALHVNIPDGPFDALYSLDVLEHIPEYELPIICEWFKIFSKRLVLGISTRKARQILANGENAHCTVQKPDWWMVLLTKYLPKYTINIVNTRSDYVTITCSHEDV